MGHTEDPRTTAPRPHWPSGGVRVGTPGGSHSLQGRGHWRARTRLSRDRARAAAGSGRRPDGRATAVRAFAGECGQRRHRRAILVRPGRWAHSFGSVAPPGPPPPGPSGPERERRRSARAPLPFPRDLRAPPLPRAVFVPAPQLAALARGPDPAPPSVAPRASRERRLSPTRAQAHRLPPPLCSRRTEAVPRHRAAGSAPRPLRPGP